jgi:purine-cytosine permease-like protein
MMSFLVGGADLGWLGVGKGAYVGTVMALATSPGDPATYAIIGAAMKAHRLLGPGLIELVYREALQIELGERQIPCRSEV